MPDRLHHVRRVVLLPEQRTGRVPLPLLRMQLRATRELQRPGVPLLREHGDPVHAAPSLGRTAVHLPAGRCADSEPELALPHEPLAGRAHERNCLGEQNPHCVPQSDRLLVGAALDLHPLQGRAGQLDRGVEGQRRELLALGLGVRLGLARRELLQVPHQLVGIAAEGESETAFHTDHDSDAGQSSVAR